jgi:hypothetical protein
VSDSSSSTPPGWFPDPLGRHEHRWFNGTAWTPDVADGGQRYVDPLGIAPGGPGSSADGSRNSLATAAMTCGIIAVLLAWIPFVVVAGVVLAVLALVFGVKGLRRSADAGRGRGSAIAGIVTGTIALLAAIIGVVLSVVVWNAVADFVEPGPVLAAATDCIADGRDITVRGQLTNSSDRLRDYTVFVTVANRTEVVAVDAVAPDETVDWEVALRARAPVADCEASVVVQGPFPFGVRVDPIQN